MVGGVEMHIHSLAASLIERGHKVGLTQSQKSTPFRRYALQTDLLPPIFVCQVIVITHSRAAPGKTGPTAPRVGVRWLNGHVKVYYLPIVPIASDATLPQYLVNVPYIRNILIRERIEILHGHAALSSMALESLMIAPFIHHHDRAHQSTNGQWSSQPPPRAIRTVFTDHSLFGFDDAAGILTNKLLAGAMRNIDAVICVSHAGRENTTLRAQLDPRLVSVLPNAIVPEAFCPHPEQVDPDYITIVVMTRLVYRKGIDLLVSAAPKICEKYPQVRFIVGGDGPKMVELEQMREQHLLQDRVILLGSITPGNVPSVLSRGQIYLSTSLTEAFGISIIEAACAGLFIVSTNVGGVPEVLPQDMIEFASPNARDVVRALSIAVETVVSGTHDPWLAHQRLSQMYSWKDVTGRTERVYTKAMMRPERDLYERLSR